MERKFTSEEMLQYWVWRTWKREETSSEILHDKPNKIHSVRDGVGFAMSHVRD